MGEKRSAKDGGLVCAELPWPLQAHPPPSILMCSPTQKLLEPCCLGIFMEVPLHRYSWLNHWHWWLVMWATIWNPVLGSTKVRSRPAWGPGSQPSGQVKGRESLCLWVFPMPSKDGAWISKIKPRGESISSGQSSFRVRQSDFCPSFATRTLCELGQIISPLWVSSTVL